MASAQYHDFLAAIAEPVIAPTDTWREAREKLNALHGHPVQPGFQGLASAGIPEAIAALERVGAFVRSHITSTAPSC